MVEVVKSDPVYCAFCRINCEDHESLMVHRCDAWSK